MVDRIIHVTLDILDPLRETIDLDQHITDLIQDTLRHPAGQMEDDLATMTMLTSSLIMVRCSHRRLQSALAVMQTWRLYVIMRHVVHTRSRPTRRVKNL